MILSKAESLLGKQILSILLFLLFLRTLSELVDLIKLIYKKLIYKIGLYIKARKNTKAK